MNTKIIRYGASFALVGIVACSTSVGKEGSTSSPITAVDDDAGTDPTDDDPNRPFDPARDWPADVQVPQEPCGIDDATDFANWDREEGELENYVTTGVAWQLPVVNDGVSVLAATINRPDPTQRQGNCACKSGPVLGNYAKDGAKPKAENALDACKALRKPAQICTKPVRPGDKDIPGDLHWVDGDTYGWDNVMKSNCYWLAAKLCAGDVCLQTPPSDSRDGSVYQGEIATIKKWCPDIKDKIGDAQSGSTVSGCCPPAAQVTAVCTNNKPWKQDGAPL